MTKLPDDPTLDEVRAYVAPLLPAHAVFDGWTNAALVSAARETGLDSQMLELAFPGGATDMINAWFESLDEALTQAVPAQTLSEMKMRDRIAALVQARLRSEEHTSELQSLMRISYDVFCLTKKKDNHMQTTYQTQL